MKKVFYAVLFFGFLSSCGPAYVTVQNTPSQPPPPQAAPENEVSYQTFYDDLSPYGQWIDYPGYGYVWMPNAGPDFKPYSTNGHWVYSDAGWVWASEYNWGWATFHYGRWFFDQGYGWMWIPGNEWAPAWVSWRSSQDYYGWAPLGPNVQGGISYSSYNPPSNYWSFVPHRYVNSPSVNNYYVNETRNTTIINNTTVINNTIVNNNITNNTTNNRINNTVRNNYYAGGPDVNEVSRESGTAVRPVAINSTNKPGQQLANGQLSLFRPRVNAATAASNSSGNNNQQRVAPARVESLNTIRPLRNANPPANTGNTNTINNIPANNAEKRNIASPPVYNNPVSRPDNPVTNPRPASAPVNNVPNVTPNVKPTVVPGNNQQFNRPAPAVNNTGSNPPAPQRYQTNNQPKPATNLPANNNQNNHPANEIRNRPLIQQQPNPDNRVNPKPALPQNKPPVQVKPALVKPPVTNKDDKKDKPKPVQQQ